MPAIDGATLVIRGFLGDLLRKGLNVQVASSCMGPDMTVYLSFHDRHQREVLSHKVIACGERAVLAWIDRLREIAKELMVVLTFSTVAVVGKLRRFGRRRTPDVDRKWRLFGRRAV